MAKNIIPTAPLPISTTPGVVAHLERLTRTHLFGKNAAETAEQIVTAEIKRLIRTGEMDQLLARTPPESTDKSDDVGT